MIEDADDRGHVLPFTAPPTEPSAEGKVKAEAKRLSRLAEVDWRFQLKGRAKEFKVEESVLRDMVVALVREHKNQIKEEAAKDQRREKQRLADRKREEREQDRAEKEAQRKRREKEKEFAAIGKLPHAQQDAGLAELARRLGHDLAALREEFEAFAGGGASLGDLITPTTWDVVPWDEPVDIASLLGEIDHKIGKYAVLGEHYRTAVVLWTVMDWVHDEIATHSPILDVASVDEGNGKTLLLGLLSWLTRRPCQGADFTGANIYRAIDRDHPTLMIDEADEAFENKQIKHIVNVGWTRGGAKIPRQMKINGELQTYWFDVFCPKILGRLLLVAKPLPRAVSRRCVQIKMWPKRADERVEEFKYCDDDEFVVLRRKLLRFANDQARAIAEIKPTFPVGFNNSVRDNWKLQLAIAELAGGDWQQRARKAAEFIAGKIKGSQGAQLFTAFHALCVERLKAGAIEIVIPSAAAVAFLKAFDPHWATEYRGSDGHPGEITQSKLAALFHYYEISPKKGTRGDQPRGYVIFERGKWSEPWLDMFARYCPGLPDIQTFVRSDRPGRKRGS